jgi:hypothetical protein
MDALPYGFEFNGKTVTASTYGADYIPELCRILDQHGPQTAPAVLEWGSGLTTQVFADYGEKKWGTDLFVTIDENKEYQNKIFDGRVRPTFLVTKILSQMGPGRSQSDPELNYSSYPLIYRRTFDVIFIDGRRRMECAFIAAILSSRQTLVIIHDYRRSRYQPILTLFESIEDGKQFRVLRPRPKVIEALVPGVEVVQDYMHQLKTRGVPLE